MDSYLSKLKRIAETNERAIDKARYFLALLRVGQFDFQELPTNNVPNFEPQIENIWAQLIENELTSSGVLRFPDPFYEPEETDDESTGYYHENIGSVGINPIAFRVIRECRPAYSDDKDHILLFEQTSWRKDTNEDECWISKDKPEEDKCIFIKKFIDYYWKIRSKRDLRIFINDYIVSEVISDEVKESINFIKSATKHNFEFRFRRIITSQMTMKDIMFWRAWFKFMGL